jgi:hypothetical protein
MTFIPDPFSKIVKIPIEIKNGKVEFYFEGSLPEIKEGTLGDLFVPAYAVKNEKIKILLSEERNIPLFKKGTELFVQIQTNVESKDLEEKMADPEECGVLVKKKFIRIVLDAPLYLILKGTKHPVLSGAKCKAINNKNISGLSLNHIYTLISQLYESERISHTGNVFKKIYYEDKTEKCLFPIERFRRKREILFDNRFYNDGT